VGIKIYRRDAGKENYFMDKEISEDAEFIANMLKRRRQAAELDALRDAYQERIGRLRHMLRQDGLKGEELNQAFNHFYSKKDPIGAYLAARDALAGQLPDAPRL
jgi:hypothetical protein